MYNQGLFDWSCKKQTTVSLSTCEAELNALSYSLKDCEWLVQLCKDMKIPVKCPIQVYQDNKACLALLKSEGCKQSTKHLQLKLQHARECIQKGLVTVSYMPGNEIPADVLSKIVSRDQHCTYVQKLGLY